MTFLKAATLLLVGELFQAFYSCSAMQEVFRLPVTEQEKVTATLYYESLCPDCHVFIEKQLVPTWNDMSTHMTVELVPYGNAERNFSDGHWHFSCQHGVDECDENLVHSCAVQLLQNRDTDKLLKFVYCMTEHQGTPLKKKTKLCAETEELFDKISSCFGGSGAEQLMLSMAVKTESVHPSLYEVPTVQINGVYNPKEADEIENNFKHVICNYLGDPQPETCNQV